MSDIMTVEQMQKGSLNLDTLEAWVEGAPNTTITTPNGRVVPTMSTAVADLTTDGIMQDNKTQRQINAELVTTVNSVSGGYFKAFDTLANLNAATGMTMGQVAKVMSDPTATNNGDYRYTGTSWVKGYDALTDAKDYTDTLNTATNKAVNNLVQQDAQVADLFDLADSDGNVVAKITSDGSVQFVGLEDSIQKVISNLFEKIYQRDSGNIFELLDRDGNIVLIVNKDSKVFIPGLSADLATAINSKSENGLSVKDTSSLSSYSYRDTFISKAQNLLNFFRNNHDVGLLAPVPLQSFEQNFSIGMEWIGQANIAEWGDYIPVKTPYGNNRGVVHPQILEFPNKFMGFRYILAITGYTNGNTREENPFLLGSNDLVGFELLTPVVDEPESYTWEKGVVYNSDPFMFYDVKTGELVLTFREYWADTSGIAPNETKEFIWARRTKDGKQWTDRELIFGGYSGTFLSQAFLYDAKTEMYHMYGVTTSGGRNLAHYTSKTLDNKWTFVGNCNLPAGTAAWHVDLKIIGDKQVATFQNRVGSDSIGFRLGISDNFHDFTWSGTWWNPPTYEVYKASFLPQFNERNEMRLVYVWTTNHKPTSPLNYKLFIQSTPFLNVNYLEK